MNYPRPSIRGIPAFGARIKELRQQRGWTQQELADKSGYCERLIRKAELSKSVAPETLEVLALTLSNPAHSISANDLALSPSTYQTVLLKALRHGELSHLKKLAIHFHSQITVDCSRVNPQLPISGHYNRKGCQQWLKDLFFLLNPKQTRCLDSWLLDDGTHGYFHGQYCILSRQHGAIHFEIDFRFEIKKRCFCRIVWLSSWDNLVILSTQWKQAK